MEIDIAKSLRAVVRDGSVSIGARNTLKSVQREEAQLVLLASNCPKKFRDEIKLRSIPTVDLGVNSVELGSMCGKPFTISMLAVVDPGSSDIMSLREKEVRNDRG
jgi:large subunit ribosomal protein L30e